MTKSLFRALVASFASATLLFVATPSSAASISFTDSNCAGFQITGTAPNFTLTCQALACTLGDLDPELHGRQWDHYLYKLDQRDRRMPAACHRAHLRQRFQRHRSGTLYLQSDRHRLGIVERHCDRDRHLDVDAAFGSRWLHPDPQPHVVACRRWQCHADRGLFRRWRTNELCMDRRRRGHADCSE